MFGILGKIFGKTDQDVVDTERRSGNSTRLLDGYVQELFVTGSCFVVDHVDTYENNAVLLRRFVDRLKREHGITISDLLLEGFNVGLTDKYMGKLKIQE